MNKITGAYIGLQLLSGGIRVPFQVFYFHLLIMFVKANAFALKQWKSAFSVEIWQVDARISLFRRRANSWYASCYFRRMAELT